MKRLFAIIFATGILAFAAYPAVTNQVSYERPFVASGFGRLPAQAGATILFGGDVMFDRYIRKVADARGGDYLFSCLADKLQKADLVVANLEGPITKAESMSLGSEVGTAQNITFTFPPETAKLLARHNIRLVNLGNNHMLNFSRWGLLETKQYLDDAGVGYFGDPDSPEEGRVARMHIKGIPVSFVNWSDWTSDKTDHTVAQVREEAESGRMVFVYTHWGDEYVAPPENVRQLAHSFVDAGAALVVGTHPHIVQEDELYKGVPIYYSIGNFIFDQYWNEEVSTGLLLRVSISPRGVERVEEEKIRLERDGRTCLVE